MSFKLRVLSVCVSTVAVKNCTGEIWWIYSINRIGKSEKE